jgi:hypothetical protein
MQLFALEYSAKTRFQARGEAEDLIILSTGKYLPYDICIRLFPTFAEFYGITNVKLFDI